MLSGSSPMTLAHLAGHAIRLGAGQVDLVQAGMSSRPASNGEVGVGDVCASTPWLASTTSSAPSQACRLRLTHR